MTTKKQIKLAEMMVDYYLLGEDWVMNALTGISTVQGLGHDVKRMTQWVQKKREERKQKRLQKQKEIQQKAKNVTTTK